MALQTILIAAFAAFAVSVAGTPVLRRVLLARGVVDVPNERSSHDRSTPRGGGVAVVFATAVGFVVVWAIGGPLPDGLVAVSVIALLLGVVSWIDDLRNLGALPRFVAQIAAVGIGIWLQPGLASSTLPFLPPWLAVAVVALGWLWFVNLFNFMDGIDGLTGAETLHLMAGLAGLVALGVLDGWFTVPAAVVAAATIGFLVWNWHPARIFLGDVGSIPLGFMIGWLLIEASATAPWQAVLILPAYYLGDATFTLLARIARGSKIWEAHREHAYQRAILAGWRHDQIVLRVVALNMVLLALAALTVLGHPVPAIAGAVVAVAFVMRRFLHGSVVDPVSPPGRKD